MAKCSINWLKAADKYHISGRGDVYCGPIPFDIDKSNPDDMDRLLKRPWVISHADARDKLWHVAGFESFCIERISAGTVIGLLVKEWPEVVK